MDDKDGVSRCPTCEGAGWDWRAYADSGTDADDPVLSWPCEDEWHGHE